MLYIILYLLFSILGLTLIKLGGNSTAILLRIPKLNVGLSLISILGFLSYLISFLIFVLIIPRYELSYLSPLTIGITQIAILIIAYFIFHENINTFKILGVISIIIGVILINIKK